MPARPSALTPRRHRPWAASCVPVATPGPRAVRTLLRILCRRGYVRGCAAAAQDPARWAPTGKGRAYISAHRRQPQRGASYDTSRSALLSVETRSTRDERADRRSIDQRAGVGGLVVQPPCENLGRCMALDEEHPAATGAGCRSPEHGRLQPSLVRVMVDGAADLLASPPQIVSVCCLTREHGDRARLEPQAQTAASLMAPIQRGESTMCCRHGDLGAEPGRASAWVRRLRPVVARVRRAADAPASGPRPASLVGIGDTEGSASHGCA